MFERLGYGMLTAGTANDLLPVKEGQKQVVAFAATTDPPPTQANHLARLHQAIVAANTATGFYATRGFSRHAEAYAKTARLGEAVTCSKGRAVPPAIARGLSVQVTEVGSTSRTYMPPRRYTRREVSPLHSRP
jgi:hypothetical protein